MFNTPILLDSPPPVALCFAHRKGGVEIMGKMRSPNYPAVGLPEAIRSIQQIWDAEKRTPVPIDVLGAAMGYKSVSGPVRTKVAAIRKYGLLEQSGSNFKLSDLGMQILHSLPDSQERQDAINAAAMRPEAFRELYETHMEASDQALKSHLLMKKSFSEAGAKQFIKAFRDTLSIANPVNSSYSPQEEESDSEDDAMEMASSTPVYDRAKEEKSKSTKVPRFNLPFETGNQAPAIQSYSFALSMPRNVRAELKLFGQVTKGDVERLKKQIEFLEEQFEEEAK